MIAALGVMASMVFGAPATAPDESAPPQSARPTEPTETRSLSEVLIELGQASALANDDPALGADQLESVLAELPAFGDRLADDQGALRARTVAWLTLARARLNLKDREGATAAIDAALRAELGGQLETTTMGPRLSELAQERVAAQGPRHPLPIRCEVPCTVTVQERPSDPTARLPAGEYRVVVRGLDPDAPSPVTTAISVPDSEVLVFGATPESAGGEGPEDPRGDAVGLDDDAARRRVDGGVRLLPRWAEIVGIAVGAGAAGVGVGLLLIHGRCSDGGVVMGPDACDDLYDTRTAGIATLVGGGVTLLGSSVLLGVDEVRVRRRAGAGGTSVRISAGIRF